MRRLTKEQWVAKANKKHHNKYDYSEADYVGYKTPVKIICPIHGPFWQRPGNHLTKKHGCTLCSPTGGAKLTLQQFLDKCHRKHGDFYDYSKVIFRGVKKEIIIICPFHGEFTQFAEKHFEGGCRECAGNFPITLDKFIERANNIHHNKYDYSLIDQINGIYSKADIICPKHGIFKQCVKNHLLGQGCKFCAVSQSSKKEQLWLNICGVPNNNLHRNVYIYIDDRKFCVDGLFQREKVIYEFLGDFWHGHPIRFDPQKTNRVSKKKFIELFTNTIDRIRLFRKHGYKVISIWESNFDRKNK